MKTGFLGRFQPFHLGHYKVIESHKDEYDEFKVIIGSSNTSGTEDNPLTFEERQNLIHSCFPNLKIVELEDTEDTTEGDIVWAEKLEELGLDIIISGNSTVEDLINKHTNLEFIRPKMHNDEIYSGTEVRRRVKSGEEWRYLTPKCSHTVLEDLTEQIKNSGTQYNFEPGWEKKNSYHSTAEK